MRSTKLRLSLIRPMSARGVSVLGAKDHSTGSRARECLSSSLFRHGQMRRKQRRPAEQQAHHSVRPLLGSVLRPILDCGHSSIQPRWPARPVVTARASETHGPTATFPKLPMRKNLVGGCSARNTADLRAFQAQIVHQASRIENEANDGACEAFGVDGAASAERYDCD